MKKYPKIGIRPTIDGRQVGVRKKKIKATFEVLLPSARTSAPVHY